MKLKVVFKNHFAYVLFQPALRCSFESTSSKSRWRNLRFKLPLKTRTYLQCILSLSWPLALILLGTVAESHELGVPLQGQKYPVVDKEMGFSFILGSQQISYRWIKECGSGITPSLSMILGPEWQSQCRQP